MTAYARSDLMDLGAFADVLMWNSATELPSLCLAHYDAHLLKCLELLSSSSSADNIFSEAVNLFSKQDRDKLLRSPVCSEQLLRFQVDKTIDRKSLVEAIFAAFDEIHLSDKIRTPLPSQTYDDLEPFGIEGGEIANTVGRQTAIHFKLNPWSRVVVGGRIVKLDKNEQLIVLGKIRNGVDFIKKASPYVWEFFASGIDVICVSKTKTPRPGLISNTSARSPRAMSLINAHGARVTTESLAEGLLHETIHSLLFTYERAISPFIIKTSDDTIISPWSGRRLSLISYVHACLVWFGLYWFWQAAGEKSGASLEMLSGECEKIASGFRRRPVSLGLMKHRKILSREVFDLLNDIENRILSL